MTGFDSDRLDWDKSGGLLPAIVQHARSGEVLMLGWMNREALDATLAGGQVIFFSRSKQRLWRKGETSGHVLDVEAIRADCDGDTLLITARPRGSTCHLGVSSCFGENAAPPLAFLAELDALVERREAERPPESYSTALFESGVQRIAQKVGEEAVETALAAVAQNDEALIGEAADLLYHLVVLLRARRLSLSDASELLRQRHEARIRV
ncbi:MAG TPA: bifunctional phosphoribosyl-AMP cyclohydrolase/phosphoribosyl-ATP diphosphatase HisIE [Rhodanobacteraceae bacterium]|nr:bifunctional phosphoribosyl-AMP cyclohydrolase/phosphoribosyl-ATP diphosphatase HisIE [Rhodanobacteraceae bacterium]